MGKKLLKRMEKIKYLQEKGGWAVRTEDGSSIKTRQIITVEGTIINVAAPSTQKPQTFWKATPYIEIWSTWGAERKKRKFYRRMDKVWNKRLAGIVEESQDLDKREGTEILSLAKHQ